MLPERACISRSICCSVAVRLAFAVDDSSDGGVKLLELSEPAVPFGDGGVLPERACISRSICCSVAVRLAFAVGDKPDGGVNPLGLFVLSCCRVEFASDVNGVVTATGQWIVNMPFVRSLLTSYAGEAYFATALSPVSYLKSSE